MKKKEVVLGAFALTFLTASASFAIWWYWNRKVFSKGNIRVVQLESSGPVGRNENIIEDGDSVYVFPANQNSKETPTMDEIENARFTKYIEETFPTRFDSATWNCTNCSLAISPHGRYYRCSDCDEYVLCEKCFISSGIEIHQAKLPANATPHTNEFIYSNMCFPNSMKKRLYHTFSCSGVLTKAFEFYKDRKLIGEKTTDFKKIYPSSFRKGYGDTVGSFNWYSFHEVQLFVEYLARALHALGAKQFDIMGICSENRLEWAMIDLCCIMKGYTSAAIPSTVSKIDFQHILKETDLRFLFCSAKSLPILSSVLAEVKNTTVEFLICMGPVVDVATSGIAVYQIDYLVHMGKSLYDVEGPIDNLSSFGDQVVAITYTSGSTGCPKAVLFKEREWLSQFSHFIAFRTCLLYGFLPMDHVSGRVDLYTCLVNGGRLAIPSVSEGLNKFFEDAQEIRPTVFGLIPLICNTVYDQYQTVLQDLLRENPDKSEEDCETLALSKFRYIFGDRLSSTKVTSAPITKEMIRFLRKMLQIRVSDGYGSTEAGSIARNDKVTQIVRLCSVPELGYLTSDSPPRGEIFVKRLRMASYANKEASAGKFKDGWFATGDIAEKIGEHSIRLIDRRSNIIKLSNGDFIAVEPLEREYLTSKYISAIYIYASSTRSRIVAIVVPNSTLTQDENVILQDIHSIAKRAGYCGYQIPAAVHVEKELTSWSEVDGLYTSAGKLCRRKLKEYYDTIIENLYVRIAVDGILQGKIDGSRSFQELGGTSVDAVRLIQQLREQMVNVTFEDLMGTRSIDKLYESKREISLHHDANEFISIESETAEIHELMKHFQRPTTQELAKNPHCYFVTGATGFLGSQILQVLLTKNTQAKFYCLCRSPERIQQDERVIPIQGDLSLPRFGLDSETFEMLCDQVDSIVHCGFVVNHLVSYEDMYNTNVRSIFTIILLAVSGKSVKPIHFTSSVSALTRSPTHGSGYGSSKWAVDHLLKVCKEKYGLPVFIYRPCLISGNRKTGQINRKDWFHRLLQAVVDFKAVPPVTRVQPLNIVPGDYCADVIVSLIQQCPEEEYQFNITQKNIGWKEIFENICNICPDIKVCASHEEWFNHMTTKTKEIDHAVQPFLSSFEHGIVSPFHAYDNRSTLRFTSDIPVVSMTREDLELTIKELNKHV